MLPFETSVLQLHDRHQSLDGVLRHDGGRALGGLPGKGPTAVRVPQYNHKGKPNLQQLGLGVVKYGVPA